MRTQIRMKPGSPYRPKDAPIIEHEISRLIEERGGTVSREELLEEETPEDASLHHLFEWDNLVAAHKERLNEAGQMLRSVEIVVVHEERPREEDWRRAFVVVREPAKRGPIDADEVRKAENRYAPITTVAHSPEYLQQVRDRADREWANFERRYRHVWDLPNFVDLLEKIARTAREAQHSDPVAAGD